MLIEKAVEIRVRLDKSDLLKPSYCVQDTLAVCDVYFAAKLLKFDLDLVLHNLLTFKLRIVDVNFDFRFFIGPTELLDFLNLLFLLLLTVASCGILVGRGLLDEYWVAAIDLSITPKVLGPFSCEILGRVRIVV